MAFDKENNPWELSKGLPLEGADVTVTDASFVIDNEYAAGAVVLSLTMIPDAYEGDVGNLRPQLYSIGKGWEVLDKGQSVAHESGKFRKFPEQSAYGDWISHVLGCEGAVEYFVENELDTHDANIWIGTKWTLGSHEYDTVKDAKGETKKKTRVVPVAFLGVEGGEATVPTKPAAATAAKTVAKPGPKPKPAAAANGAKSGLDAEVDAAFAEMAKEHEDFDQFMNAAFEYAEENGLGGNKDVEKAIMSARQFAAWRVQ